MTRRELTPLFKVVVRPIRAFFRLEAASGIVLLACAVIALIIANSGAARVYDELISSRIGVHIGARGIEFSLLELVNDGLMALFFFVVGMEIKRELVHGELRTPARALLPGIAALGGMIVPSLIYLAFNWGGPGQHGWGIPMATDIAFCIGCLTLLRRRVSHPLIVFVTALAIFDDIGGILVIALFYGHGLDGGWLLGSAGVVLVLSLMGRLYVRRAVWYVAAGALLWLCLHQAGIHATIAGVVLGLAVPARAARNPRDVLSELATHTSSLLAKPADQSIDNASLVEIEDKLEDLCSPLDRFVNALHPWVAFGIMPVFALVNAGVTFDGVSVSDALGPVSLGTGLGLFVGKQVGIFLFTFAPTRLRLASSPGGASPAKLYGVATVAGIGFTVALFIASLAFASEPALLAQAKIGILAGSAMSGLVGSLVLRMTAPSDPD